MQRLAELRSQCISGQEPVPVIQARLFGLSGLLPSELPRGKPANNSHLRSLWDEWWRDRDALAESILPRGVWRLNGLRPANHPHRRLALAAHWLCDRQLPAKLIRWGHRDLARKEFVPSLLELLQPPPDPFWDWRFNLNSTRSARRIPLLGETRVTDLAINVVLPWAWARTGRDKNSTARERIERRYFTWPAAQDNSVLKLARQRLLGGNGTADFRDAAAQQGLMQIVRDFCETSNALCENCKLPGVVADYVSQEVQK